jgi:phosphoribosylamine--glycine ligase/phosphoribosylformylglycinamidine cyclo-ligase
MITESGPKVLEYNVRFGDPETETLLPLLTRETDLAEVMLACTEHWLDAVELQVESRYSATVIAVAGGYPGSYTSGEEISICQAASNTIIFHAGTTSKSGTLKTAGGRVLAVTATAATLKDAIKSAYDGLSTVHFSNMHYRKDIGHRALSPSADIPQRANIIVNNESLTYASAGVSISAGNQLVRLITPLVKSTARPGADATIGGFGGMIDLFEAGYSTPPLIIGAIDGVGTKLNIAHAMGKHDTIGIDCVAMNVNDLVVQGAEPLFFLDCYTCGKLDIQVCADFVKGVVRGCIDGGCALVGGETAEMPGLFTAGGLVKDDGSVYDAVGAAVGALRRGDKLLPDKENMLVGDILLGLASNGCHSNGFSLTRKIIDRAGLSVHDEAPWDDSMSVGESLLTPTRIYVKPLLGVAKKNLILGMSHITGGGLLENIPRMLPKHLAALVDVGKWPMPTVFRWLKTAGKLEDLEYARAFNTGLGMVLVVSEKNVVQTILELEDAGEMVFEIGKLVPRTGDGCELENLDAWKKI